MDSFKEHVVSSFGIYEGVTVPLEQPMIEIEEATGEYKGREVELNQPRRSSERKKYVVYVGECILKPGLKIAWQRGMRWCAITGRLVIWDEKRTISSSLPQT